MTTSANLPSEMAAIDAWHRYVIYGENKAEDIPALLRRETPPLLSWIVRGGCAVQCKHCIFPFEGPKAHAAQTDGGWIHALMRQMPQGAHLVHEGRQLLPWQVPVLKSVADAGYGVSVINNGQYTTPAMLALIEREGLSIDTLDVSVDGTPAIHNAQRSSQQAWTWAMKGLNNARRILKPTGKVTSLYTLTSLNCSHVREAGKMLAPLVDEWHLTTMSLRSGIEHLRASKRELAAALEQFFGTRWDKPVFLRSYSLEDFVWLMEIIGKETARKALVDAEVTYNAIVLNIGGIPLYFYPKSLWANETLVVDADGWWRLPYSVAYTLDELQAGVDKTGEDISHFSIAPMSKELDLNSRYPEAADKWWEVIGRDCLSAERAAVQRFLTGEDSNRKEQSQAD
jgi:hypothetical protein